MQFSPVETMRNGDTLVSADILPPYTSNYLLQGGAGRNLSLRAEKQDHEKCPLPPPTTNSGAMRRRASGGFFLDVAPPAKKSKPKTVVLHVCNPGPCDSPTSPVQRGPHSQSLRIIPPTPLPPPTPARTQSNTTNLTLPVLGYPTPDLDLPSPDPTQIRAAKMHRRLGGSVGSIPASVLAELRSIGESSPSWIATMLFDEDGANDEDDEDAEEKSSCSTDIDDVRRNTRISLKWVRDLGGDRWIADRYSDILRAV
ncbi:hypothetical protein C8R44DRAFT_859279 [Mycena epipterygia]|nr:hypothetical protein C8R44DRAFT_859279 [Mycena epipterygia]